MTIHKTDIVIIGAGPCGLFSIFEAGMLKLHSHVIDALDFVGGQCTALYPEKPIYDIPGYPKVGALELVEKLAEQSSPFKPQYHLSQKVEKIAKENNGKFLITTSKNTVIEAGAIIIAAGCGAFGPNRPPIENIEEFEGKSVFYMVNKMEDYRNKTIVIAGGGDSAADWAINLSEIATKIYFIHRRNKFRCAPDSLEKMEELAKKGKIEFIVPYQLENLIGKYGYLEKVVVKDLDNNIKEIDADILLPFFGLRMELGPISEWGLGLDKNHIIVDPVTMQTNHEGIFAIGDICTYPGKLKLILTGFAEAAIAAHSAFKHIHPNEVLHFEYSTTKGVIA